MDRKLGLTIAFVVSCAKSASSTASLPEDAAAPVVAVVEASAPVKRLPPLTQPANDDFRVKSFPDSMTKVGSVLVNRAAQPFVEIVGIDVPPRVHVEEGFVVRTYFKVLGTTTDTLEIGLRIVGMKALFNGDHPPMGGNHPTPQWKSGELLVDAAAARVMHPGSYKVYVAVQMPNANGSLKVKSGPGANDEGFVQVASFEAE